MEISEQLLNEFVLLWQQGHPGQAQGGASL